MEEGAKSAKQTRRSKAERRRVVEETLKPGTSVSRVAPGSRSECEPGVRVICADRGL
jgi:hypothetical protein